MMASARRPSISARYFIAEPPTAMEHPAASSRDDDAHRPTDREELTLSPRPSETAAAASQNRTLRTDRLYQKDPARQTRRRARENPAENATLLSYLNAPQDPRPCPCITAISGPAPCSVAASMLAMFTAQRVNQTAS